jgi:ATP-binding cassette subfamily F protein uup
MKKELAWLRRGAPARTAKPKFRIEAANALIADEPPARDTVSLASMAMQRLGKDVVDLLDVSVSYGDKQILKDVEWRIAPGERTGILGVNGAGKSTLLSLVAGSLQPTTGRVKRGKTIKVAVLTQQLDELKDVLEDRVSTVIGRQRTTYVAGGKEMTPATYVAGGGQKRRLQLLLIVLDEPNVLILDEPTNDLDTDMLAAMEDLLDSFPGTLLVVSHDRYLLERVTDQQYAVMNGNLRHLPGGVDQYLKLRQQPGNAEKSTIARPDEVGGQATATLGGSGGTQLQGAELRNAQKELASITRKLEKADLRRRQALDAMAEHDPNDYDGLGKLNEGVRAIEADVEALESRWMELSELLEG